MPNESLSSFINNNSDNKNKNDDTDNYSYSSTSLLASSSVLDTEGMRSSVLSSSIGFKDVAAKVVGYVMGMGAMMLYSPIIITLLRTKNSNGFSISTWVFNVFGTMLAISYPVKRGFPISTYVELITVLLQGMCTTTTVMMMIYNVGDR